MYRLNRPGRDGACLPMSSRRESSRFSRTAFTVAPQTGICSTSHKEFFSQNPDTGRCGDAQPHLAGPCFNNLHGDSTVDHNFFLNFSTQNEH